MEHIAPALELNRKGTLTSLQRSSIMQPGQVQPTAVTNEALHEAPWLLNTGCARSPVRGRGCRLPNDRRDSTLDRSPAMAMRFPENYLTTLHTRAPARMIEAELAALTDIVGAGTSETAEQRKLLAIESHLAAAQEHFLKRRFAAAIDEYKTAQAMIYGLLNKRFDPGVSKFPGIRLPLERSCSNRYSTPQARSWKRCHCRGSIGFRSGLRHACRHRGQRDGAYESLA